MSSTLARIEVRMPADLKEHLTVIAKERGVSLSDMAVSALQMMLETPAPASSAVGEVPQQIQELTRLLETFIKTYLSLTPEVAEGQKQAAAARGRERWQQFQRLVSSEGQA
jgi:hypothetical protein